MDGNLNQQLICRACLRIVENKSQSFGYIEDSNGNLKDMIMCCVPEMDIYVSSQPIMCFPCIQVLVTVYNFKTRCLNTETIIRSYIQRNNLMEYNHVNLSCVVQELLRLNKYFREMNRNNNDAQHTNNPHVEDQRNIPKSQIEEVNVSNAQIAEEESVNQSCVDLDHIQEVDSQQEQPLRSDEQNEINENQTHEENSTYSIEHYDVSEKQSETQTDPPLDKSNRQDIPQYVTVGNEIVQRTFPQNFPPPQRTEQQHIPQYNLPLNHMGQRIFPFPPSIHPPNFQNRAGERMFVPSHFNIEHRMRPYHLPAQGRMPERMFVPPQMGMDQRFAHCVVPGGQMGQRFYRPPLMNMVQRVPHFGMPANHMGERIYYLPPTRMEDNSIQAINRGERASCPHLQADTENKTNSDDCRGEREEQPDMQSETSRNEEDTVNKDITEINSISNDSEKNENVNEDQPMQNKVRIILRIDKSRIINSTEPYDRNEDSNEKENEQQDVEMSENGKPPPESNVFLHPPEHDQELYQCSNCTFVTTNQNYHIAHRKICLNELEKNEKKCPHCPHVTNRQYALNKHINTMHTKAVWYTCDFCTYRSTDSSCLRRHKRNVHPERVGNELTCHMCSYRCTTEYHLRKHLLKHDENTNLQCQFCSYSTRDRSNFRKHIFIHNPKPKECEFCDYKCVSPYQMKVHLKKYHHGVGLEDIDCRSDVSLSEVVDDISNAIQEAKSFIGHVIE